MAWVRKKRFRWALAALAPLVLYLLAALVGSLVPVNAGWREPDQGVTIYLHDNGIHTSLILPRADPKLDPAIMFADLRTLKPDADSQPIMLEGGFPGPAKDYPFLAVGWGDKDFFLNTATWADVRPSTALYAVFGSGATLIHVDQLSDFPLGDIRKIKLRPKEYEALMRFVGEQLASDHDGGNIATPGYGADDRFYDTQGPYAYSGLFTCNNWIAAGLAEAGVRVGLWTPFAGGVMWWF